MTLTSQQRDHSASAVCSSPLTAMPALEHTRSMPPCCAIACCTNATTSASRDTSHVTAVPPISCATCAAVSPFMSATTTAFAPSAANRRHSARPMPFPPPVTTTTRSVSFTVSRLPFQFQLLTLNFRVSGTHPCLQPFHVLLHRARGGEQDDGEQRRENRHDVHRFVQP